MAKRKRRRRLKKSVKFGFVLIIALILSVIYLFTNSKKYLFFKGLNNSYDSLVNIIDDLTNNYVPYSSDSYYSKTDSSINVVTSEIDSTIKVNGDVYLDGASNYFDVSIDANDSIYDLELLTKEEKLYFKVDDSKYYYTSMVNSSFSKEKYYNALSELVDGLKDNVKSGNLSKEKTSLLIDGEKYNTKKLTLHIDEELYNSVFKSFYAKMSLGDLSFENDMYLSIYLYKSKTVQIDLYNSEFTLSFVTYKEYVELDFVTLDSMSYIKFKDGNIDFFIDGIIKGIGKYNDQSFKMDFTDMNNNSIGNINYSINKNNNKYTNKLSLKLDLSDIDINLSLSNEITPSKKLPDVNVNNSIIVDNISNQDKETISKLLDTINIIFAF